MRTAGIPILLVVVSLFAGCSEPLAWNPGPWKSDPPDPPADAPAVNCVVTDVGPRHTEPFKEAGAVVVARCTAVNQYATVRRGNWDFFWSLVACDVIRVERGRWPHPRVVFCCYDPWPTPESGIMVNKMPFPYAEGRVLAIALDPDAEPPRVLDQQWRSRLPPHGEPTYMDAQGDSGERLHDRVWAAVRDFAERDGWPRVTGGSHFEVTDDAYVAEVVVRPPDGESERRAVAVDKETFAVREVP